MWLFNSKTGELKELPKRSRNRKKDSWEHLFEKKEQATIKVKRKLMMELQIPHECWRRVEEADEEIYISNEGRIKRVYQNNGGSIMLIPNLKSGKGTKPFKYTYIRFNVNGRRTSFIISRLVARYFPIKGNGDCLLHLDRNVYNNAVSNLKWESRKKLARIPQRATQKPVVQIEKGSGEIVNYFSSITQASSEVFLSRKCIQRCLNGTQKEAGGFHWKIDKIN